MIKFYYSTAPNPMKVALCLEEMGLAYDPIPVDTRKGEQHKPAYLAINPNAKVPAIVDGEVTMFDSNAIVLYLAEKTGKFLPAKAADRGPMLSWLMFVASGVGPFTGQYVHFKNYAPEKISYAVFCLKKKSVVVEGELRRVRPARDQVDLVLPLPDDPGR